MRAARAEALAAESAAAAEPLRFAAGLFRVQAAMVSAPAESAPRLLLEYAAERGPAELARDARSGGDADLAQRVSAYRSGGPFDFLARAALVPQALLQREKGAFMGRGSGPCPYCGGIPWMASRRSGSSADGAMRILHCATCWHSWQVARIRCPACGEENPDELPSFTAPEHPAVRIEACESCGGYLKSIDLTLDARPIPEVDDLTSLALDLWAGEQGFERLEPGLAGV
jgi:FdhE protein